MRLPGDKQNEKGGGSPVVYTIIGVSAVILVILAVVLLNNRPEPSRNKRSQYAEAGMSPSPEKHDEDEMTFAEGQKNIEALYREKKLRAEDLDFWDMYKKEATPEPSVSPTPEPSHEPTDAEKALDGKHTLVSFEDGSEEWLAIDEDLTPNTFDYTKMKIKDDKMTYYDGNQKISWLGVDLSKDNGEVDFKALKQEGIDFVMIRLGTRGYESGLISLDDNFVKNMTGAADAGIDIGITFFSQAVSMEEAIEEAQFVIDNLVPYKIKYPVAFDMEYIKNDTSRIDILDEEEKTKIANAFLSSVKKDGYYPILYGNKPWLLAETNPNELKNYDVWLADQSSVPDYPYQFQMWRYMDNARLNGVETDVSLIISFIDYTKK